MHTTSSPRCANNGTRRRPIKPVPPRIKVDIGVASRVAGRIARPDVTPAASRWAMTLIGNGRDCAAPDRRLHGRGPRGTSSNYEPQHDQLLVGTARTGGAWRPDLRPDRPILRLFRNGIVYRPRGKIAAQRDMGDEQSAAHAGDGGGDHPRRSPRPSADPQP